MNSFETTTGLGYAHRPLWWVCVCFSLGIVINEYLKIPFVIFSLLTALGIFLSLFTQRSRISTFFLLLAFVFLGLVYAKNYQIFSPDHVCHISYGYRQEPLLVEGVVVSYVEKRDFFKGKKTIFTLEVRRIRSPWGWKEKKGVILVNLFREEDVRYGDYLILEGKLHRPFNFTNNPVRLRQGGIQDHRNEALPGYPDARLSDGQARGGRLHSSQDSSASYRDYLYRKGITFILSVKKTGRVEMLKREQGYFIKDLSFRLKHKLNTVLKNSLPRAEAGLMQAFLLGDRYDIPPHVYELFKISGVVHIIAISGFNIGIVAYVLFIILKMFPIPRTAQYILTMVLLVLYAFLTGGQPPVVRATIMTVVFLASFIVERESEPINTLSVAALILLIMNPLNLFDVGFQLSFISVLSIILFYAGFMGLFYKWLPGLKEEFEEERKPQGQDSLSRLRLNVIKFLLQSMAVSLAAYLGVVALVVYYFRLITPVVIVANLVVVPLASLIIFLGMGLLAAGIFFPFIAFAFAGCIVALLNLMVASVFFFAQIPGAYFYIQGITLWHIISYYILLFIPFLWIRNKHPQGNN